MAFIDKLKEELDRAGRAAQGAFDEGKVRLEAFRTRQLADKAAQALGYAVFRAKQGGGEIEADTYSRLAATLATHDAEASKHEADLELKRKEHHTYGASTSGPADTASSAKSSADSPSSGSSASSASSSASSSPYASGDAGTTPGSQDVSG